MVEEKETKALLNERKSNIIETLNSGKCKFEFLKADNSVRLAEGTLSDEFLPPQNKEKTKGAKRTVDDLITYFDTEKNAFRSFKLDRFVRFVE